MFLFKILKFWFKTMLYIVKKVLDVFLSVIIFIFILTCITLCTINVNKKEKKVVNNYSHLIIRDINYPSEDKYTNDVFTIYENKLSFYDVLSRINDSIEDDKIKDILIDLDSTYFTSAQIEELTPLFEEFKEKGKKIYAYGENISNSNYSIAILADIINMPNNNTSSINLLGYSYSSKYFGDILRKYGIKVEVLHIGSHKSYGEEYSRNSMSLENKESLERVYDIRLENYISRISKNRKLNQDIVKEKLLDGKYAYIDSGEARDLSLVDSLMNYNKFTESLDINDENSVDIHDYFKPTLTSINKDNIAIIYLDGDIMEENDEISSPYISSSKFEDKLNEALSLANLKGIVIRINSPGGSANEAKKIYDLIQEVDVPVYISVSNTAASGGYYIASAGDKIFINNASITGSIGVVSLITKYVDGLSKLGIGVDGISKGKYTNILNPEVNLTEEDRNVYIKRLERIYKEFKEDILVNRTKLDSNRLEKIAQGKIWLGEEAVKNGLADEIGGLYTTITSMQNDLKLDNVQIINIYGEQSYYNMLGSLGSKLLPSFLFLKNNLDSKLEFILNQESKPMYYMPEFELNM